MEFIKMFLCVIAVLFAIALIVQIVIVIWTPSTYNFKLCITYSFGLFIFGGFAKALIDDDEV